jgi:hypothetical protein
MAKKKPKTGIATLEVVDEPSPDQPQEQPAEKKVGKGMKACPKCGELVEAMMTECPTCHEAFPVKAAKKTSKQPGPDPRTEKAKAKPSELKKQIQDLQTTAQFVIKVGGLEQARKMLGIIEKLQD